MRYASQYFFKFDQHFILIDKYLPSKSRLKDKNLILLNKNLEWKKMNNKSSIEYEKNQF